MNSNAACNSVYYNTLKQHIEELRAKVVLTNEPMTLLITQLLADADALETARKKDMRAASTDFVQQKTAFSEFAKRFEAMKEYVIQLETKLEAFTTQPHGFGVFLRHLGFHEIEDRTGTKHQVPVVDVRDMRGNEGRVLVPYPEINVSAIKYGQRVLLSDVHGPSHLIEVLNEFSTSGREANVVALMDSDQYGPRAMLSFGDIGENRVCWLADNVAGMDIGAGSRVLVDPTSTLVIDVLAEKESSRFLVDEIPTTTFADIGGLDALADEIRRDFIWPMTYSEKYKIMGLPSPRGCLLSGPPGVGKTLTARAIVNLMAEQIEKQTGIKATGHFFHIGGPELLDKFVGNTESYMREIFAQAKKVASSTSPVIIFFDEMDALFPQRGTGISSDVNLTHVPQFTSLMDGLEDRGNVIVIGATNREELIDPAVLRSGRCDKVFRIPRPDAKAAAQIFAKYLLPQWGQISPRYDVKVYIPLDRRGQPKTERYFFKNDPQQVADYLIERAVKRMYDTDTEKNRFIELKFHGRRETTSVRYGDLASGAMIANIVERAKKLALFNHIEHNAPLGVEMKHLYLAIEAAFAEQRAPKTLDEVYHWLQIEGKAEGQLSAPPIFVRHVEDVDAEEF